MVIRNYKLYFIAFFADFCCNKLALTKVKIGIVGFFNTLYHLSSMPDCSLLNSIAEQSRALALVYLEILFYLDCPGIVWDWGGFLMLTSRTGEVGQELEQFSASSFIHQIESQTLLFA